MGKLILRRAAVTAAVLFLMSSCAAPSSSEDAVQSYVSTTDCADDEIKFDELVPTNQMELLYADQFSVDRFEGGYAVIRVKDGCSYLLVPENAPVPNGKPDDMTVISQPIDRTYLAATSAADLICSIGAADRIKAVSTKRDEWSVSEISDGLDSGDILYVGKYSAPDYENLITEGCTFAVESTMIYHTPAVKEQLERLGIPVFTERSSYESHPLGRLEWIRLYGLIFGEEDAAESFFSQKAQIAESIEDMPPSGKTAVFFYVNQNGSVCVRKPGDYVSKMIEMAGGVYALTAEDLNVDENALSTANIQMEAFYSAARDADVLIYNSTVDGGIGSIGDLIGKNELFADFKAVKNGNVWCTDRNMFQQTSQTADMTAAMSIIFSDGSDTAAAEEYFHHLS